MTTKERLLTLFETHKGDYFSGEDIAATLDISRAAVWKAVQALRREGYAIDAVSNRGYCLSLETDILSAQGIAKYLSPDAAQLSVEVHPEVNSTNTLARERAIDGAAEGLTVIAGAQSGGRGRGGRPFFSPAGTGVYMSVMLRPTHCPPSLAVRLTTMAAVAVCEAIADVSGEQAQIKWVNDIFLHGKKVCGILTEASFGLEDGNLEYAILGMGINVCTPAGGFPEELRDIAGAVFPDAPRDGKNRMAAAILNRFWQHYTNPCDDYIRAYRERCLVLGKTVQVLSPDGERPALALDVDDDCHLLVQYADGERAALSSGEIRVKLS